MTGQSRWSGLSYLSVLQHTKHTMKIITLITALSALNACSEPRSDDMDWDTPSTGRTAWGGQAPRTNHHQNQICVVVRECTACVYADLDSKYADSKQPEGARALAEIARRVTYTVDYREPDACAKFVLSVERAAALETEHQLNHNYKPSAVEADYLSEPRQTSHLPRSH